MDNVDLRNTVVADNQIKSKRYVRFGEKRSGYPKILFVGNSMAWHAPKNDIGWSGDWGMAASKEENDYVHQTMQLIRQNFSNAAYCIAQCAYWERNMRDKNVYDEYSDLQYFDADVVVIILGENIIESEYGVDELADNFSTLIDFLRKGRANVPVFISKPFLWEKPIAAKAIEKAAAKSNAIMLNLEELSNNLSYRAIGQFKHSGVAAHPGDVGMRKIAEIVYQQLIKVL